MRPVALLAMAIALFVLPPLSQALETQGMIPSQALWDQFGKEARIGAGQGRPHILLVSDRRESPKEFADWSRALSPLPPELGIQALANLQALPFFLPHELIAMSLRKDLPGLQVLLDWKGKLSAALAVPPNATAVLVYSPSGRLVGQVVGPASAGGLAEVRRLVLGAQTSP